MSNLITFSLSITVKQLSIKPRKKSLHLKPKDHREPKTYPSQLKPSLSLPNPLPKSIKQTQDPEQLPKPQFP